MMNLKIKVLGIFILMHSIFCGRVFADSKGFERVIWNKQPIAVQLQISTERMIEFPADVRFWLPDGMERLVSILSAGGVLYVKAHQPFPMTRLRVQNLETQTVYLIDIFTGDESVDNHRLVVTDKAYLKKHQQALPPLSKPSDVYVQLVRFAAQSLYSPERLMPESQNIHRFTINKEAPVRLVRGGAIESIPVDAWKGFGFYVTAIRLRNLTPHLMDIVIHSAKKQENTAIRQLRLTDDIRGSWLTLVPHHMSLGPSTSDTDRTTLYLVSSQPFVESLTGGQ